MEQVVSFVGIETKSGSNDNGGWTLYKFKDGGGNTYITFDDGIGQQGMALMNQPIRISWVDEPRQYQTPQGQTKTTTQHVLQSIEAAPGQQPVATRLGNTVTSAGAIPNGGNTGGGFRADPSRDARIASQWALGLGHEIVKGAIASGAAAPIADPDILVAAVEATAAKLLDASGRLVTKIVGSGASSQPQTGADQTSAWTGQQY